MNPYGGYGSGANQYSGGYGGYGVGQSHQGYSSLSQNQYGLQYANQQNAKQQQKVVSPFKAFLGRHKKPVIIGCVVFVIALLITIQILSTRIPTTYTVSFNAMGGTFTVNNTAVTTYKMGEISPDSRITRPTSPVRSGYTFDGWYRDNQYLVKWDWTTDRVTADITLFAKWKGQKILINFDLSGGNGIHGEVIFNPIEITFGEPYGSSGELPEPMRLGFEFIGWHTLDGERVDDFYPVNIATPHLLIAKWKGVPITVSFVDDIESREYNVPVATRMQTIWEDPSEKLRVVNYREPYGKLPVPSWPGWNFEGWWTNSSTDFQPWGTRIDETSPMLSMGDHSLYAKWSPSTIQFTSTENERTLAPQQYDSSCLISFPAATVASDPAGRFTYSTTMGSLPDGLYLGSGISTKQNLIVGHVKANANDYTKTSDAYSFAIVARHDNHPASYKGENLGVSVDFKLRIQRKELVIPSLVKTTSEGSKPTSPIATQLSGVHTGAGTYLSYTYTPGRTEPWVVDWDNGGQALLKYVRFASSAEPSSFEEPLFKFEGVMSATESSFNPALGHRYEVVLTLLDTTNFVWSNGSASAARAWIVDRSEVVMPKRITWSGYRYYTGNLHPISLQNIQGITMADGRPNVFTNGVHELYEWKQDGAKLNGSMAQREAGTYSSLVAFNEDAKKNYKWKPDVSDNRLKSADFPGDTTEKSIDDWIIYKARVQRPKLGYNSFVQAPAPDSRHEQGQLSSKAFGYIYNGQQRSASFISKGKIITTRTDDLLANHNPGGLLGQMPQGPIGASGAVSDLFTAPSGELNATGNGTYSFYMELADDKNYEWDSYEGWADIVASWERGVVTTIATKQRLTYSWYIQKFQVTAPTRSSTYFNNLVTGTQDYVYNAEPRTVSFVNPTGYTATDYYRFQTANQELTRTGSGDTTIVVVLNDPNNYEWKGTYTGTDTSPQSFTWTIEKYKVPVPAKNSTYFNNIVTSLNQNAVFDGTSRTVSLKSGVVPKLAGQDLYSITTAAASLTRTDAGSTNVTVQLSNKQDLVWSSGGTADQTYSWVIDKLPVPRPTTSVVGGGTGGLIGTGLSQTINSSYSGAAHTVSLGTVPTGPVGVGYNDAPFYKFVSTAPNRASDTTLSRINAQTSNNTNEIALTSSTNTRWADITGSTQSDNVKIILKIDKYSVGVPTLVGGLQHVYYPGASRTLTLANIPTHDFVFKGGTETPANYAPSELYGFSVWGSAVPSEPTALSSAYYKKLTRGANAGDISGITVDLIDKTNFQWSDTVNTYKWEIKKATITAPVAINFRITNGDGQTGNGLSTSARRDETMRVDLPSAVTIDNGEIINATRVQALMKFVKPSGTYYSLAGTEAFITQAMDQTFEEVMGEGTTKINQSFQIGLLDTNNYQWSGSTIANRSYTWEITRIS